MKKFPYKSKMSKPFTKQDFMTTLSMTKLTTINLILLSFMLGNMLITFPNVSPIHAQRVVTVTADQPNIWTLEQAHYLLAQMHRRNLDLKAKRLDPLDANEINGVNLDILRSILEIGATYNQADAFNNSLIKTDKKFDAERRRQLTKDIDKLNEEKLELTRIIARLKREKETAENEDAAAKIEASILEHTEIKSEVESQISSKTEQLGSLSSAGGNVTGTTSSATFDATKFPPGLIDSEIKVKLKEALDSFGANPKLNASLQLDKFLQLQYEIISKQLTLLRDEVGPGERLLFLELPQSINATYDKSNKMWAQSRWRISGYTACVDEINGKPIPCPTFLYPDGKKRIQNRPPRSTLEIYKSITNDDQEIFDKFNISIFDIKEREELAKKFVQLTENTDNTNSQKETSSEKMIRQFFNRFYSETEQANTVSPSSIESQARNKYKTTLDNYLKKEKEYKELLDTCSKDNFNTQSNCNAENLEKLEKELKELKEQVSTPSATLLNLILRTLNEAVNSSTQLNKDPNLNLNVYSRRTTILSRITAEDKETKRLLNRLWLEDLFYFILFRLQESDFPSQYFDLTGGKKLAGKKTILTTKKNPDKTQTIQEDNKDNDIEIDNRIIRTVEIIPRQSSFNVNDVKVRNKSSALNFIVSTLFGLGGNFNYQQQRERYSQFVQQELYSSGFGKGAREFGWTFTSMPGTNRLLSGTRNTYAVVIIPKEAISLVLESTGCSFRRAKQQPQDFADAKSSTWQDEQKRKKNHCSKPKSFLIPVPGGGSDSNNDFYVSGMTYKPVKKGKRIVMSIYGDNFSHQTGIMINGVPLLESIGLAQNFIRDDSNVSKEVLEKHKSEKIRGSFERVDSNQIIASFEIDDGENGTPVITLVSPGKALDLNPYTLYINGRRTSLQNAEWMFGVRPPTSTFQVSDTQIFVSDIINGDITELTALLSGKNLHRITGIFVNGQPITTATPHGFNILRIVFPPPNDDKIQIVLIRGSEVLRLKPITKPTTKTPPPQPPSLDDTLLSFNVLDTTPIFEDTTKKKVTHLLVKIEGIGLNSGLTISNGKLDVASETLAYITIANPKPAQTIRLTNTELNIYAEGVVTMPKLKITKSAKKSNGNCRKLKGC